MLTDRRITDYLFNYWHHVKGANILPCETMIEISDIEHLWHDCFLIKTRHLSEASFKNKYSFIGDNLSNLLHDKSFYHLSLKLENRMQTEIETLINLKQPIIIEEELKLNREMFKYRQCLLPFTKGDKDKVEFIFGGLRWIVK